MNDPNAHHTPAFKPEHTDDSTTAGTSHNANKHAQPLIEQLVSGSLGPLARLQESIDMSLGEVSEWIGQAHNRHEISNLVTLLDAQTQLLICQQRLLAVARLTEVARQASSPETVRRACADLLKIRLIDPYEEDKRPEKMPPEPPIDEQAVLEALEHCGHEMDFEFGSPLPDHSANGSPDGPAIGSD